MCFIQRYSNTLDRLPRHRGPLNASKGRSNFLRWSLWIKALSDALRAPIRPVMSGLLILFGVSLHARPSPKSVAIPPGLLALTLATGAAQAVEDRALSILICCSSPSSIYTARIVIVA